MGWDPLHCWVVLPSPPSHPAGEAAALRSSSAQNSSPNRVQMDRIDLFSCPEPFLPPQHCQGTPRGLSRAGTVLIPWPGIPELGFSAAETEQFLTFQTSRERDLSTNPCSNSSGHWKQPQISFWSTCSKIPPEKRFLSRETAESTWFSTTFGK